MNKITTCVLGNECSDAPHPLHGSIDLSQRNLYARIMQFDIDDGPVSLTFTQRLARENGWSAEYAGRVVHEYKRFIFLVACADRPITPSDQIDQAWHLHLTYTHSYWERLCNGVVGRPLHHTPTRGGREEAQKFDTWYLRALESYRRIFEALPPPDIWSAPGARFADDRFFRRINIRRNWVIRNPWSSRARPTACVVFLAGLLGVLGATIPLVAESSGEQLAQNESSNGLLSWIIIIMIVIFAVLVGGELRSFCPTCVRYSALEKTGTIQTRETGIEWDEFRCKFCASHIWKERSSSGGGGDSSGGGCGGCGGGCGGG